LTRICARHIGVCALDRAFCPNPFQLLDRAALKPLLLGGRKIMDFPGDFPSAFVFAVVNVL
jgi:hypothetical protein